MSSRLENLYQRAQQEGRDPRAFLQEIANQPDAPYNDTKVGEKNHAIRLLREMDKKAAAAAAAAPAGELHTHTVRDETDEEREQREDEHAVAMLLQARQRARIISPAERAALHEQLSSVVTPQLFDGGRTPATHERARLRSQDELCSNIQLYHTIAPEALPLIDAWFAEHPDTAPDRARLALTALLRSHRELHQVTSVAQQLQLSIEPYLMHAILEVLPQ